MSFLSSLTGLFSRSGRDDSLLLEAMDHAKAKRPEKALAIYNSLIDSAGTRSEVEARALFNRALAYSSMDNDEQAIADLEQVMNMPNVAENVQAAVKSQLIRVRKRVAR